jgi:hypothetical protein
MMPENRRAVIVSALKEHLKKLNINIEVFEIYAFDKENFPLIVIKDTTDDVETANFEGLKHELSISISLITTSYSKNDELTIEVLQNLKDLRGGFNFKTLESINRSSIEVLDKDYVMTQLSLKFVYHTGLWEL